MNENSRSFLNDGAVLPLAQVDRFASGSGLRSLVVAGGPPTENNISLNEIWRVLLKWWWLIAGLTLTCLLMAAGAALLVTPEYRATATLEVNPQGLQVVQVGSVDPLQTSDREFITTQAGLLRSRSQAERVARSLNLANNEAVVDQELDRPSREAAATDTLFESVTVEPVRDSRLIEVRVESTDPQLASRIANAYGENFIQANLERRFEANSYARNFLEQRLAALKARLEDSERQLVRYAQRQQIIPLNVDTGSGDGGRSEQSIDSASLVSMNQALSEARSERIAAEQRYRQGLGNDSTTETISNPTIQSLKSARAELQAEYQQKLALFQPSYPQMIQLDARIKELDRAIQRETTGVSKALRSEFEAARARENQLEAAVERLKGGLLNLRERSIQYTILQREVDTNRSLYDALLQRYKEVGVAGGVGENAVSVVDLAQVPQSPFTPNLPLNIAVGLLGGLLVGLGLAFGLEWLDDTIKRPDDVKSRLGVAALGVVPRSGGDLPIAEELEDPKSEISEAYQSVRATLEFSTDHGVPKTLLITSTRASEGKSSSALAIARTLASLGAKVLLIDADLRKPTFRGPSSGSDGLSNLLAGSGDFCKAVLGTTYERLHLLPAGPIPPNPAELLASRRIAKLIEQATEQFDHVVIDGPPVLGLADAPLLSSHVEGTVMIIEAGGIRRIAAMTAVGRLRDAGANLLGAVLTKFNATKSGYGYGYGYGYGGDAYAFVEGEAPRRQIRLLAKS